MRRLIGIDYGRKRLGIAVTDPLGITVQGQPTLIASGLDDAVSQVADFAGRHAVGAIVIGLPLNMNGTRGEMAKEVERFGQAVESVTGVEVTYWDERLTSEQAKAVLQQRGETSRERGDIDRVAACLMLESFLRANQT